MEIVPLRDEDCHWSCEHILRRGSASALVRDMASSALSTPLGTGQVPALRNAFRGARCRRRGLLGIATFLGRCHFPFGNSTTSNRSAVSGLKPSGAAGRNSSCGYVTGAELLRLEPDFRDRFAGANRGFLQAANRVKPSDTGACREQRAIWLTRKPVSGRAGILNRNDRRHPAGGAVHCGRDQALTSNQPAPFLPPQIRHQTIHRK